MRVGILWRRTAKPGIPDANVAPYQASRRSTRELRSRYEPPASSRVSGFATAGAEVSSSATRARPGRFRNHLVLKPGRLHRRRRDVLMGHRAVKLVFAQ
jgi:hypothetical protein